MAVGGDDVITDVKRHVVDEIHKPARINFKRRKIIVKSLNDLCQADLGEVIPYAKVNKGYKYIMVVINCCSKYVWMVPMKNGSEVGKAMETVLKQQSPNNLQTDSGLDFFNKHFEGLMKKDNVSHYSVFSGKKAAIVERVNQTLKNMMWKEFSLRGNCKWIVILPKIVEKYNKKKHQTIGMRPIDVTKKDEKRLLNSVYNHIKMSDLNTKFKVGDYMRISKIRGVFDKAYLLYLIGQLKFSPFEKFSTLTQQRIYCVI